MTDPFGTAGIRQRVLAAWAAAPVRFREDANAEEDLALGGYRDRLVVELAQNAADAASRAGRPGRLSLTLAERPDAPPVLVAANTGAPLTAEGVQSLATLRASAKVVGAGADDVVGRFGVGFAAVLAVCDEPVVLSRSGGVRFSREDSAALVADRARTAPALDAEVRRRDGHVPVLRLPFEADGEPPNGFDTAVVLPLRDEVAADAVRAQLAAAGDALLLGLPSLAEVVLDVDGHQRVLAAAADRWIVHRRSGRWSDDERARLLADRPTEERRQRGWQVLWAVPRAAAGAASTVPGTVPQTVHAPTPTDEPLSVPALLLATLPLDPTRRHVAAGPLADRLVRECAEGYVELLTELAADGSDVLSLVPVGLPVGALDGALREHVLRLLPGAPVLHGVEDGRPLRPRDAVVLDVDAEPAALSVLASRLAGLTAAPVAARSVLRALDVRVVPLAEVVETLPAQGDPASWRELYAGLAPLAVDPNGREALAALPVPLADGRVVRGARGLLVGESDRVPAQALEALAPFGLRVVHPQAAHPLLERLGALPASARSVLDDPAVRLAVEQVGAEDPADDAPAVTEAVLSLVAAAVAGQGLEPGELPWLGELLLTDDEGDEAPAGMLCLPGSVAADLLDLDEMGLLDDQLARSWPADVLRAVGVLDGLALCSAADPDLQDPPEELAELDGFEEWSEQVRSLGVLVGPVTAVRDLDVVRTDRWEQVVQHLAGDPELRRALVVPVRVRTADDVVDHPSYGAWWLGRELDLSGTVPPQADDLGGVLPRAPQWLATVDPVVRGCLGVVEPTGDQPLPPAVVTRVVDALTDPDRQPAAVHCLRLWWLLSRSDVAGRQLGSPAPQHLWVLDGPRGDEVRWTEAVAAVVPDDPRWVQRTDLGGQVVAAPGRADVLADLLDLDLASERADGAVTSGGVRADVPDVVRAVLPGVADQWWEHDELAVDGVQVDWWVADDGGAHAATSDGLARALAWAAGAWPARFAVAEVLQDPSAVTRLLADG